MSRTSLTLKRANASPSSGEWKDEDYDVLADGVVVGRIFLSAKFPVGLPWMWTLIFGYHEGPHADARLRADARGGDEPDFAECPLSGATRPTFARDEFFSVWPTDIGLIEIPQRSSLLPY